MNAPEELLIKTTTAPPVRTPHRTENDNEDCWRSLGDQVYLLLIFGLEEYRATVCPCIYNYL